MNITFLHRIWPVYGGGETVTKCLANELVKRGHEVSVLYTKQSDREDKLLDHRIKQVKLPNISYDESSSEFFVNKKIAFRAHVFLKEFVVKYGIDILINQWWPVEFLGDIRNETGVKVIKCLHMDPNTRKVFSKVGIKGSVFKIFEPLYRVLERQKHLYSLDKYIKYSDRLIFLAPSFLKYYRLKRRGNEEIEQKTDFVFNPLVYEVDGKSSYVQKEKTVLFVGRLLEKHKQITRILKVWKQIELDQKLEDWRLQIVGDGPDRILYETVIRDLRLQRVSMEGYQFPLPYYHKASLFVMTSAYEGFPMTLVEALQNRVVPVVMDSYQSVYDIIVDGVNGIIVPDGDITTFIHALKELMKDDEKRKKMLEEGYKSCECYAVNFIVDNWESIFHVLKNEHIVK